MQDESHLRGFSVGSLDAHAAEPEDAASAAAGRQQLLDDGFVLLLQRQHDSRLQEVQRHSGGNTRSDTSVLEGFLQHFPSKHTH